VKRRRVGVIGTFVWDRIHGRDAQLPHREPVEEWGGIAYALSAFDACDVVVEAATELFPMMLLARVQKIEQALGRRRSGLPARPRTIDIDILLYGASQVRSARLEIPHPRMHERRFVLAPMAELVPDLRHPQLHKTMRELLAGVEGQKVRKLGPS
jgi:7,8-dihydro-6-hydroxymethylpterin-pyrophosphokinase